MAEHLFTMANQSPAPNVGGIIARVCEGHVAMKRAQ
jgi:hypothetical protein